jgi:hypothetical protein
MRRSIRYFRRAMRGLAYSVAAVVATALLVWVALQTDWAKDRLRALAVRQANQFLAGTLSIRELRGSLFGDLDLRGVTVALDGRTVISIDELQLSYSFRELLGGGTSIRRIRVLQPVVLAARDADGRWNLSSLVKRNASPRPTGPGRRIQIQAIEIDNGRVTLGGPVRFGAVHLPEVYTGLNVRLSLEYQGGRWAVALAPASFSGSTPDLQVNRLEGGIADDTHGLEFRNLLVQTPRSQFVLDGRIDRRSSPSRLPLSVEAGRFAFQEWSGLLPGLSRIAIESGFTAHLDGPLSALATRLALHSNGGILHPGYHGPRLDGPGVGRRRAPRPRGLAEPAGPPVEHHGTCDLRADGCRPGRPGPLSRRVVRVRWPAR